MQFLTLCADPDTPDVATIGSSAAIITGIQARIACSSYQAGLNS
jgi:hypothetical protein